MDKPTIPQGTRDFGPAQMAKRQFIFNNIRSVFQKYGFQPLETPTMENLSTLTGKYGEEGDQLLFKVLNTGDFLAKVDATKLESRNSKQLISSIAEKGLRYDLTVPFARYVVMNRGEISFPFKRYQIQPVWRADRPQKGRYREFYQCDADVVGTDSLICEADIVLMIKEVFNSLGIQDFTIKINHRAILSGLAELMGSQQESSLFVAIDKLDKIGEEKVKEELRSRGFADVGIDAVFDILNFKGSTQQKIDFLKSKFSNSEKGKKGIIDFEEVLSLLKNYGATEANVEFDISLARGLSYYTGCIFEVKINNVAIGSVSGGGRYDNLTGVFGLPNVSGVGISFGIDRLYDAMEELKLFPEGAQISSKVMIAHFDDATLRYALGVAYQLRKQNIATEVYPDLTKVKKQLEYANKKMIPFVIVIGADEMKDDLLTIKNMKTGEQEKLKVEEIVLRLAKIDLSKQN
jgi:histidyl-tRNA synthetase